MLAPNTDTIPASVHRYLLPHERQVITIRYHPAVVLPSVGLAVAGLIAAVVASSVSKFSPDALLIIWLVWGLLLLYMIARVARWFNDWCVVTSGRLLVVNGLLARDVASMPLFRATDMRIRRSALGRLLGYGQLIFDPRGQEQVLRSFNFMPYPEQIYLEICGLIYREPPDLDD